MQLSWAYPIIHPTQNMDDAQALPPVPLPVAMLPAIEHVVPTHADRGHHATCIRGQSIVRNF